MLTKEECAQAIITWKLTKQNYNSVEEIINPSSVFSFSRAQCDWLNQHNDNSCFHTYIGVYNNELTMIIVPINSVGHEIDLPSYAASSLGALPNNLNLIEELVTTKTIRTTLSTELQITSHQVDINLPFENEPSISENQSISAVNSWNNKTLDWFYNECTEYDGQRIFETFTVPLADLARDLEDVNVVYCLFGLRESGIYNRLVPLLIFVAESGVIQEARILRSGETDSTSGNMDDFSSPCPPFCRDKASFSVFN